MSEELRVLLEQVASPGWRARMDAVQKLAARLPDPDARAGIVQALCDPHDTAVIEAAAEALAGSATEDDASVLLTALALEGEQAEIADHVATVLWALERDGSSFAASVLERDRTREKLERRAQGTFPHTGPCDEPGLRSVSMTLTVSWPDAKG